MQAYRMTAWKTLPSYHEVPQPDPHPGQVLVKVAAAGICHSDLHVMHEFDEGVMNAKLPFTLGHENAGWVEALGAGATGLEIGQPVAVFGPQGCGRCPRCRVGDENLCDFVAQMQGPGWGLGVDGGMAPYMVVDSPRQLVPIGDLDPIAAAPLTDAAVTPYRAIKRSLKVLVPGSFTVVIGVGGLGHMAVQLLRALSATTIIALDGRPEALALASSLGAHHLVASGPDAGATVRELTKGRGADLVLDVVGIDTTLQFALGVVRAGGQIKVIGAAGGTTTYGMYVTPFEVEISSTIWGGIPDLIDVIELASSGLISAKVTTFAFDRIPDAYHAMETGTLEGRGVILPNG